MYHSQTAGQEHLGERVKGVNNQLVRWCSKAGVLCFRTCSLFTKGGSAQTQTFKGARDQLYLNGHLGHPRLSNFFSQQLSDRVLLLRMSSITHKRL